MYLVTTDKARIPSGSQIIMVDGTVPGWEPQEGDLHYDHHKPGGAPIQIAEIAEIPDRPKISDKVVFVTTQVDADAQASAAWIQILQLPLDGVAKSNIYRDFSAIAYDCDHLGLPADPMWDNFRSFAAKAVAALKEAGNAIADELDLPANRREWSEDQKVQFASVCFERGTQWLIDAALGKRTWPGAAGEADAYFDRMNSQREQVYANCHLYKGCAIFDQRSFNGQYVDPRLLVEWARENGATEPVTLTVRDGSRLPNGFPEWTGDLYSYTLGSIPLHDKGSPKYSDRGVWESLGHIENQWRLEYGWAHGPETAWGGRNEVGGSGWRDPAASSPHQVIDCVLGTLLPEKTI